MGHRTLGRRASVATLWGTGFALVVSLCVGCATTAPAIPKQTNPARATLVEHADNDYEVTIRDAERHFRAQESPELCWAACVQTVHSMTGRPVVEQQTMRNDHIRELPNEYREAAFRWEVRDALAPEWRERFNMRLVFTPFERVTLRHDEILDHLSEGEPIVVGLRDDPHARQGHAYVLYGARYKVRESQFDPAAPFSSAGRLVAGLLDSTVGQIGQNNQNRHDGARTSGVDVYELVEVRLYDPWPDDASAEGVSSASSVDVVSAADFFKRLDFTISARTANDVFANDYEWLRRHDKGQGVYVRPPRISQVVLDDAPIAWFALPESHTANRGHRP